MVPDANVWRLCGGNRKSTLGLVFRACLLALSRSGRHERTTVFTLLLCAGPIEGCSDALAVRRYCWLSELGSCLRLMRRRINAGPKNKKLVVLCSSEAIWLAGLIIQLGLTLPLQGEHLPSSHVHLAVGTPQGHDLDREECLCRELATLTQIHTRALPGAVVTVLLLYCSRLW